MLGRAYFYTRDHLGSVRELTNSTGTVSTRMDYDPYGVTTVVSGTVIPDFAYAGMYQHQPSGNYLSATRLYNPNLGRWLTRDPIQESGGLNMYAYAGNNPINFIDPSGLVIEVYFADGSYALAYNLNQFVNIVRGSGAGTIDNITFHGHANEFIQTPLITDNSAGFAYGGIWNLNGEVQVWIPSPQDIHTNSSGLSSTDPNDADAVLKRATLIPLKDLLKGKLSKYSSIYYEGCHTGDLAKATSNDIANTPVYGWTGFTRDYGDPGPHNWGFTAGAWAILPPSSSSNVNYNNGQEVDNKIRSH